MNKTSQALDAKEILRQVQITTIEKSPRDFCNNNMIRRFLEANTSDKESIRALSDEKALDRATLAAEQKAKNSGFLSLPIPKDKERTTKTAILLIENDGLFSEENPAESLSSILDEAETVINSDPCSHPKHDGQSLEAMIAKKGIGGTDALQIRERAKKLGLQTLNRNGNPYSSIYTYTTDDSVESSLQSKIAEKAGPLYFCQELVTLSQTTDCGSAMENMAGEMRQRGQPPVVSMPALLDKILNSGNYDKALRIAANKLIAKARNPEVIQGDLYTDVESSFKEAGYSTAAAERMAFETLGMIATGGAGLKGRLKAIEFSGDRWPTATALSTIAALTPYLDYHSAKNRNVYSFPPGVQGQCDTSKSYHFWMAAFLARNEAAKGTSPEAAAAAAYSAAKAYHVIGNSTTRRGASALLQLDAFAPATNIVRADLSYASAGALYGAGIDTTTPLSIDAGIRESLKYDKINPKLSAAEAADAVSAVHLFGYGKFKDGLAPNQIYEHQSKGRKFKGFPSTTDKALEKVPAKAQCPPSISR